MELRWFQLFVKSQNSNFFEKKLGFPWCSTREDLSIDEARYDDFFSRGEDRRTDTDLESSYGNMSAHKKFQLKAQN